MRPDKEKPAPVATGSGTSYSVQLGGERPEGNGNLKFRLEPGGDAMTVAGREAQTLRLLVRAGAHAVTSGEASSLGWARGSSHYASRLRRKGVDMATLREQVGHARIRRYVLKSPVVLLREGEARPCV